MTHPWERNIVHSNTGSLTKSNNVDDDSVNVEFMMFTYKKKLQCSSPTNAHHHDGTTNDDEKYCLFPPFYYYFFSTSSQVLFRSVYIILEMVDGTLRFP